MAGPYWLVDVQRKIVAVSMAPCFSSRKQDRGSDCVPFLKQALDGSGPAFRTRRAEAYYGKEEWRLWTGQSSATAAEAALEDFGEIVSVSQRRPPKPHRWPPKRAEETTN